MTDFMVSREKVSVEVLRVTEKSGDMLLPVMERQNSMYLVVRVTSVDSTGITAISERKSEFSNFH